MNQCLVLDLLLTILLSLVICPLKLYHIMYYMMEIIYLIIMLYVFALSLTLPIMKVLKNSFLLAHCGKMLVTIILTNIKRVLSGLLSDICVPNDVISCNNPLCCEHEQDIDNYSSNIVNACVKATTLCIPHSVPFRHIAGWTEKVKPYKERSIFWYRLWIDNGKPRQGTIFNIMNKCRLDYKRISKQVIRSQNYLKLERMAQSIVDDTTRNFCVMKFAILLGINKLVYQITLTRNMEIQIYVICSVINMNVCIKRYHMMKQECMK